MLVSLVLPLTVGFDSLLTRRGIAEFQVGRSALKLVRPYHVHEDGVVS